MGQTIKSLDTVVLTKENIVKNESISLLKKMSIHERQCGGWGQKAATFIPSNLDSSGKVIEILKYATSNIGGTKGLDYLPFKANLYTVDTITGKPKEPIIEDGIITKKTEKGKFVEINILEYNVLMPKEGIFVMMEILPKEEYPSTFIKARLPGMGLMTISCVPAIKAYNYDKNYVRKSYASEKTYEQLINKAIEKEWYIQDCHYIMDLELK